MDTQNGYKYEVHLHTAQSSKCGSTPGEEYIAAFKAAGYDGIIVTDHFFYGNTGVDRNLPWPLFVDEFCKGYEAAKEEGDKQGFKVFFGWEENFNNDEYLVYGLDKEWLKAHHDVLRCSQKEMLEMVHEGGGAVVQAHPFRERGYIRNVNVHPFQCDAMEASNFGNPPEQDILAYNFCKNRGITMTSGSDIHNKSVIPSTTCGMLFDKPLESIHDYVDAIKSGKGFRPLISPDRMDPLEDATMHLPTYLYDENNKPRLVAKEDIFKN